MIMLWLIVTHSDWHIIIIRPNKLLNFLLMGERRIIIDKMGNINSVIR